MSFHLCFINYNLIILGEFIMYKKNYSLFIKNCIYEWICIVNDTFILNEFFLWFIFIYLLCNVGLETGVVILRLAGFQ